MSHATPQMRKFATCLIAFEEVENESSAAVNPQAFYIFEKLRPPLATLMGHGGFRALLSRALLLAKAEVPWLRTVHVEADGSMEGLDEQLARLEPKELLEGRFVLLAELLGLLVAFIGERLTLGMVRDVWPKARLNDWDFGKGVQYEKAE